ncbi:MAG: GntR family transcriptional regulator [Armatimonadota bacterium]
MKITINELDDSPIYQQIISQIKEHIHTGELKPGDELPSVRDLSKSIGVNIHTIHKAYQKLREQQVIVLRLGQRAKVAEIKTTPVDRAQAESIIIKKLNDLSTEAFHLGISEKEFRKIIKEKIKKKE